MGELTTDAITRNNPTEFPRTMHGADTAEVRINSNRELSHGLLPHESYQYLDFRSEASITLAELTGYRFNGGPRIAIYEHPNDLDGQFYKGNIHNYGMDKFSKQFVWHEWYHYAQHRYRESEGGTDDATSTYLLRRDKDGNLFEPCPDKGNIIKNAINEAGAYLFGYYTSVKDVYGKDARAGLDAIFYNFMKDYGVDLQATYDKLMKTVLSEELETPEMIESAAPTGGTTSSRVALAALFAGLMYEMDGFDMGRTLTDLLQDPNKNIARILNLGTEGADEHFNNLQMYLLGLPAMIRKV